MTGESSGRWDATGSFLDAVFGQREHAFKWASDLPLKDLHWMVTIMASDANAFTLYERKAILEVVALRLGAELDNCICDPPTARTLPGDHWDDCPRGA